MFQEALSNVASGGTQEEDDMFDFVTAAPVTIVANEVAELRFLAKGASIEEESESFDVVITGYDDDSRS